MHSPVGVGRSLRSKLRGAREGVAKRYLRATRSLPGEYLDEREWDLLVVVDACRYDLFTAFLDRSGTDLAPERTLSPGSSTLEWLYENFRWRDELDRSGIHYVCANPYSKVLDGDPFHRLEEVWRTRWDADLGTVHPAAVTEAATEARRTTDADRLIVHYMQPHAPFLPADPERFELDEFAHRGYSVWDRLRRGELTREAVREQYLDNLAFVMDHVADLCADPGDDRVVLTSDHGNCLGEWGIYGHPYGVPLEPLQAVPWCPVPDDATIRVDREFDVPYDPDGDDIDHEERLRALGYR